MERRGGGTLQRLGEGQMFNRTVTSQDRAGTDSLIIKDDCRKVGKLYRCVFKLMFSTRGKSMFII